MPDLVRITAAAHPFKAGRSVTYAPQGQTVAEMLRDAQPDPVLTRHAIVFIEGEIVPRHCWALVRPKAGTLVEIKVLPTGGGGGGGGKSAARLILTIVVIVAASYAGGLAATALTPALGTALAGAAGAVATAAASAVGMMLVNALVPIRPPGGRGAERDPSFSISGSRNRLAPFEPVPQVLGRHRMAPPFGAAPFTEIVGGDQYIRLLFVWGVGPVAIDTATLKIGETPLTDFTDVETEHREGYAADAALTLFPDTVAEDALSLLLTDTVFRERTSGTGADELSVDIMWPGGLFAGTKSGGTDPATVTLEINYREVGDVTWLTPTFTATTFPAAWISGDTITVTAKTRSAVRHGARWAVASRGQYEVRVRRSNAPSVDEKDSDDTYWQVLRTITNEDPINSAVPVAKTVLRIKATDQLNRVIDTFNGVVTTKGDDWNGAAWVADQEITNPASLYRHVLQGNAIAAPLADARIDLTALETWHDFCAARGFAFNQVRGSATSVWETLADVAGAGRAAPAAPDGKWGVVIEQVQAAPVSHVTPRNSFGFTAERAFIEQPHGWRIAFPNEDDGWRGDERRVYRDSYDASNATRFEALRLPGVTDPEQVQRLGRFRIAQFVNQPERWTFGQDMEFLTYQRGDRIAITHDVLLVGERAGRIKAVTLDGGDAVTAVEIDEEVTMLAGTSYGIAIRTVDDANITRQVVTAAGPTRSLTLTSSIAAVGGEPAVARGDLFGFGTLGAETEDATVIAIAPDSEGRARVTAVPYRAAIFDIDGETVPPFTSNLTPLPVIPAPVVAGVVSDESVAVLGPGQSLQTRVAVSVAPLDDPRLDDPRIRVQARPTETGEPFRTVVPAEESAQHVSLAGSFAGETIDIRLRFEVTGLTPGPWSSVNNHTVVGKSTPPGDLTGLTVSAFNGQAMLRWNQPDEIDVRFGGEVRFRHSPLMTGATWAGSASIGQTARARDLIATLPLKPGTYMARVFDQVGNPSDGIASVVSKQTSVLAYSSADTLDEDPAFGGAHSGTVSDGGTLKLEGVTQWDSFADVDLVADIDAAGGIVSTGTYDFLLGFDLGSVDRVRLTTRLTMASVNTLDQIDDRSDLIDDWEDFDGVVQSAGDVRIDVRHTDDDPAGAPTWSAWERLDSAEFEARGFDFRAVLTTIDTAFNVHVTDLGVDAEEVT